MGKKNFSNCTPRGGQGHRRGGATCPSPATTGDGCELPKGHKGVTWRPPEMDQKHGKNMGKSTANGCLNVNIMGKNMGKSIVNGCFNGKFMGKLTI